jgi:hypothetical protein
MTLTDDAQSVFAEHGLDRDDALLAAKTLGQQIIDDSQSTDTPLAGIVYEVWGLYDDGMPACRFGSPGDAGAVEFAGKFRTARDESFVERRRTVSMDDLKALLDRARPGPLDNPA